MMYDTLLSKTLLILAISLIFCVFGSLCVIRYFRNAFFKGETFVTAKSNHQGQIDLEVDKTILSKIYKPAIIINIISFITLLIFQNTIPVNFIVMSIYTFSGGVTIGAILINKDENLGLKVTSLTALITLLASLIAMYSGIDFSFLSNFLFYSLLFLIVLGIYRILFSITETTKKLYSIFGIIVFIGYLLLDFYLLSKGNNIAQLNTWNNALDFAINIYLDIINLFLDLLDLLSD